MRFRLFAIIPAFACLFAGCFALAFLVRFDFDIPMRWQSGLFEALPYVVLIQILVVAALGEWKRSFRYATLADLVRTAITATAACNVVFIIWGVGGLGPLPRSVLLVNAVLVVPAMMALRSAYRLIREAGEAPFRRSTAEPTLIYIRDEAEAIGIARALCSKSSRDFRLAGFVQDGERNRKSLLVGQRVYSVDLGWDRVARRTLATNVLVPAGHSGKTIRRLVEDCRACGLKVHVIPNVTDLVRGRFKLDTRDVTISDLLRREPNKLDIVGIQSCVAGKNVMVTGGAGSIGSELCRQILALQPTRLVVLDQSEYGIFTIEQELRAANTNNVDLQFVIADVVDPVAIEQAFETTAPDLVFHAAAYKHVPLMEQCPEQAVRNNLGGTKTVADLSHRFGVERFVLVSTDKAVRPTSVMGATKLLSEKYIQGLSSTSDTTFLSVRFGNVLNSAGSVIPTFRKQIQTGGPLTVTHPEMVRFFMTIPEAVQLVLQAGAIGSTGDVLILDMGEPVKIVDLAKDMIRLSGLNYPDDIDIEFTGIRPGEKLFEELYYEEEAGATPVHEKIFRATPESVGFLQMQSVVSRLESAAEENRTSLQEALWQQVAMFSETSQRAAA